MYLRCKSSILDISSLQVAMAINVKSRILFASDIWAVKAKYYRTWVQKFMSQQGVTHSPSTESPSGINICHLNVMNDEAFTTVCQWLLMPEQQR